MWPRGHISNRMRSALFRLRLLRQCGRGPRCTLLPDQLDFARGRERMHGSVHGRSLAYDPSRGFLARRGEPGGGTRCWCLAMTVAVELALRGTSLAADSALSRLAVQSDQSAGNLRCRRVGRTVHRRRRERLGGRRHDKGFGRAACGAPHAARRRAEGDCRCHHGQRIRTAEEGETAICGTVQNPQSRAQRSDARDRAVCAQTEGIFRPNPLHDSPAARASGSA